MKKFVERSGLTAVAQACGIKHKGFDLFASLVFYAPATGHQARRVGQGHPMRQLTVRQGMSPYRLEHLGQHRE